MTLQELYSILKSTGFPVSYYHFKDSQKPPFICYFVSYSSNFDADNKVYQKIENAQIELYTDKKDLEAEKILEDLLDENEIPYETAETFIESEKLYQKIYEVRLI